MQNGRCKLDGPELIAFAAMNRTEQDQTRSSQNGDEPRSLTRPGEFRWLDDRKKQTPNL